MKKFIFTVMLVLVCVTGSAQQSLFNKYAETKGISSVYISKAMLGMMDKVKAGKNDIGKIAGKLEHVQIMSCERPSMIAVVKRDALNALKKEGFEQMMQVNDDGENVGIYHKAHHNNRNEFTLLCVEGSNELQVINILGNVTMKEIKDLMAR